MTATRIDTAQDVVAFLKTLTDGYRPVRTTQPGAQGGSRVAQR